jgi:hypothetical protein
VSRYSLALILPAGVSDVNAKAAAQRAYSEGARLAAGVDRWR